MAWDACWRHAGIAIILCTLDARLSGSRRRRGTDVWWRDAFAIAAGTFIKLEPSDAKAKQPASRQLASLPIAAANHEENKTDGAAVPGKMTSMIILGIIRPRIEVLEAHNSR